MNKLYSALFTILILLSAITVPVSAATPCLTAKYNNRVEAAKEFEVEISLKNNPGLNGIMISAYYDTEVLSLVSTKNGGLFKTIFTTSQTLSVEPYKIMWITTDLNFKEITEDGIMVTYVFKVKDNAPLGKTDLKFEIGDFTDNKNTKTMNFDNASVTVNIEKNKASLTSQSAILGTVDHSTDTSSKNTAPTSSSNNVETTSKTTSTASSINNTSSYTPSTIIESSSSQQTPQENGDDYRPVNGEPQEQSEAAPSFMPIILIGIVILGAGIIGGITLIIKNKR